MISEKTLLQVIERLNYAIIICNLDGTFELWNKKAEDLVAVNSEIVTKEVWGEYFNVFKLDGTQLTVNEYPISKALNGKTTLNDRILVKNKNLKNDVIISVDSFPIENNKNKITGAVVVFTDITDKVKMEKLMDDLTIRFDHIKTLLESSIKQN